MKILIFIFVILITLPTYSQTRSARPLWEIAPSKIQAPEQDTALWMLKQEKFYLGYHWVGPLKTINELLHINFYHGHWFNWWESDPKVKTYFAQMPNTSERKSVVWQPISQNGLSFSKLLALQFDPERSTDANASRTGDTTGAIFGFNYRNDSIGTITNSLSDDNFVRYVLHTSAIDSGTSAIVLSEPVITNGYKRISAYKKDTLFNGTRGYISINLRRTNTIDTAMNNDTILTITLPYIQKDSVYNSILFDSIAVTNFTTDTLPFNRGLGLKLRIQPDTGDAERNFIITRGMLPKGNASEKDITISAFFRVKDTITDNDSINPTLKLDDKTAEPADIVSLMVSVRYHGISDVGIDWIRFEVPFVRAFLRSYYDTTLALGLILHNMDTMRHLINTVHSSARILSFYGEDEPEPQSMLGQAHFSRLLNGRWLNYLDGRGQTHDISRPAFRWISQSPACNNSAWGNPPTSPFRFVGDTTIYCSIKGSWGPSWFPGAGIQYDSITGSAYETLLFNNCTDLRSDSSFLAVFDSSDLPTGNKRALSFNHLSHNNPNWKGWYKYPDYLYVGGDQGQLPSYETYWYNTYKIDTTMIFSGQPWWTNIWIGTIWHYGKTVSNKGTLNVQNIRPATGEETRLQMWGALIHGCKGLILERMHNDPNAFKYSTISLGETKTAMLGALNSLDVFTHSKITDSLEDIRLHNLGERIFDSTMIETGGDFIVHNDSTYFDQYIDTQKVRTLMGINPQRFYIGRLSTRHEVKRTCDIIGGTNGIGSKLMKLRLKASWYKGYEENSIGDTALFRKFINLDTTQLRTRPIGRSTCDDADSSFVNVTLLNDTTDTKGNVKIIGVLNLRTAPFVWLTDSDSLAINRPDTVRHISHPNQVLTFLTTVEFDNYVQRGKLDKYSQSGAREITIPFNYKSTHGYALLQVRELGGGIDTVIGQDRPLAVKFLPGEGKMFNVEILHPDTTLAGNLSYTNQRKLIGFPKLGDSDSIYYHLTYHKPIPGSSPSRSAVYYRRSEAMRTNSSTQNIIWQKEILVSKSIRLRKGQNDTIASSNCAYPSLVVRYDNSSLTNNVFVVYSCEDEDTCFYSKRKRIVETILPADDSSQTFNWPLKAETLSTFYGSLEEYGTPMINASDSGNYYCWADSLLGIVAGWKHTDSTYLEDSKNISYQISNAELPSGCKHPSMNSYSRLNLGENDCALVWQEKFYSGDYMDKSRILYTRLQMINGFLTHYLPPTLSSGNGIQILGLAGNIGELSNYGGEGNTNYYLPSVYREIADSVYSTTTQQRDVHVDCAAWHSYGVPSGTPTGAVHRRRLSLLDTNGVANTWTSDGISRVRASGAFLNNVSLSQGDAYLDVIGSYPSGGFVYNASSRSHIMTFTESPVFVVGGTPAYRKLWQIQSNSYFAPSFHDTSLSAFQSTSKAFVIDNDGAVGQTAALPRMNTQEEWRKNRRVYEGVTVGSLRRIQASAEYFLKQTASSEIEPSVFSGFHDGESTYMLSNPILNGSTLSLDRVKRLRGEAGKFGGRHGFTDTLETNWFTVGDEANLMLKSIGKNADLVSAFVERRSDGERFTVQLRTSDDTTALWTRIPLLRGGVEEYKFFMVKNSVGRGEEVFTIPDYVEEMVLGEMKTSISFNKGNNDIQAIDLGRKAGAQASIRVFPNPAQDKVSVVVLGNNPKDVWHIKVMNVLGDVMSEHEDKTSSLLEIVTEDYPSGVYYITAESGRLNATARFVIMK